MFTLKGIYRDTIRKLWRAHQDYQAQAQRVLVANEEYNGLLAERQQQMQQLVYDAQTLPEAKYILLNTQLDELEKLTVTHLQRVAELEARQAQLSRDVNIFLERCAADHPGIDRQELAQLIEDTLKMNSVDANF